MQNKYISPPDNCTGCGLCANVCSQDAIRMEWSKEGFLVPQVDISACVNCGLCVKMCPAQPGAMNNESYTDDIEAVVAYGGWNNNTDIHLKSSSGGIFTALAEHVIEQGGIVFGVVWKDKYTAIFDKTESVEGLSRMRGSKYTPAVPGGVYRNVKTELQTGRQVLFSGTPCQVHALKKYLRKPYDNLLTIDIVCHGVPSHLILEKYISEDEARSGKTIEYVSFRDKPEGWMRYHVTRHYTDGSSASEALNTDIYMRMFLCDKALNLVCYNCPYAHIPRQGDITLGDYWGVQNHHPEWPIDMGISAILVNSDKGNIMLRSLENDIVLKQTSYSYMFPAQSGFKRLKIKVPYDRKLVIKLLHSNELLQIRDAVLNTAKVGPFRLRLDGELYKVCSVIRRILGYFCRKIFRCDYK